MAKTPALVLYNHDFRGFRTTISISTRLKLKIGFLEGHLDPVESSYRGHTFVVMRARPRA